MWAKKSKVLFKPKYFDNVNAKLDRRWDYKKRKFRAVTQDPLFFDYDQLYLNGGITPYLEKVRSGNKVEMPLNKRAYLMYHVAKQKINDPDFFIFMEKGLQVYIENEKEGKGIKDNAPAGLEHLFFRFNFAAVTAYWRTNFGSAWALEFWEEKLINTADELRAQEVVELCEAFRENRTHHRDHMRNLLTNHLKKPLLKVWPA